MSSTESLITSGNTSHDAFDDRQPSGASQMSRRSPMYGGSSGPSLDAFGLPVGPRLSAPVLPCNAALTQLLAALQVVDNPSAAVQLAIVHAQTLFLGHPEPAQTLHLLRATGEALHDLPGGAVKRLCQTLIQRIYRDPRGPLTQSVKVCVQAARVQREAGQVELAAFLDGEAQRLTAVLNRPEIDGYSQLGTATAALRSSLAAFSAKRQVYGQAERALANRGSSFYIKTAVLESLVSQLQGSDVAQVQACSVLTEALGHMERAVALYQEWELLAKVEGAPHQVRNPDQVVDRALALSTLAIYAQDSYTVQDHDDFVAAVVISCQGSWQSFLADKDVTLAPLLSRLDMLSRVALRDAIASGQTPLEAVRGLPRIAQAQLEGGNIDVAKYLLRATWVAQQRAVNCINEGDPLAAPLAALTSQYAAIAPTAAALNDNLSGRAFESLLADELIRQMPSSTQVAWQHLGQGAADLLDLLRGARRDAYAQKLHAVLVARGTRPWDARAPKLAALKASLLADPSGASVLQEVLALLRESTQGGYGVLIKAELLRATWACLGEVRLAPLAGILAPTEQFYVGAIGARARRTVQLAYKEGAASVKGLTPGEALQGPHVTIMAAHQPSPIAASALSSASSSNLRFHLDLDDPHVAQFLQSGAVVASGVSGSANTYMGWLAHLKKNRPDLTASSRDVALGAAAFLIHDAGHSLNEVLWTVRHGEDLSIAPDYEPQKATTYADFQRMFADDPVVQRVIDHTFVRLADFTAGIQKTRPA